MVRKSFNLDPYSVRDKIEYYEITCPICKQLKKDTKPMKINPPLEENTIITCPICRSRYRIKRTRGSSFNPSDVEIILQYLTPIKDTPFNKIINDALNMKNKNK